MTEGMVELDWKAYNEPGTKGVRRGSLCARREEEEQRRCWGVAGYKNVTWSRSGRGTRGTENITRGKNRAGSRVWKSQGFVIQ